MPARLRGLEARNARHHIALSAGRSGRADPLHDQVIVTVSERRSCIIAS
jgi:hypothetical protein